MKLKREVNIIEFFDCVKQCEGDVHLHLPSGEELNLKSTLSQYVFSVLNKDSKAIHNGQVYCNVLEDYRKLEVFLGEE